MKSDHFEILFLMALIMGTIFFCLWALLSTWEVRDQRAFEKKTKWDHVQPTVSVEGRTRGIVWMSIDERKKFYAMSKRDQEKYVRKVFDEEDKIKNEVKALVGVGVGVGVGVIGQEKSANK